MSDALELDVLRAAYGDCLILRYAADGATPRRILFDGGPTSCWEDALEPYLEELHGDFADSQGQLVFELGICSHIDRDHIRGLIGLTRRLVKEEDRSGERPFVRFKEFWHNNLRNTLQLDATATHTAALESAHGATLASLAGQVDLDQEGVGGLSISDAVLASYGEGNELRRNLATLGVDMPFVNVNDDPHLRIGDLMIKVLAPSLARIEALREEWEVEAPDPAELAATLDGAVPNLASIVTLIEFKGKKLLLTGDAVWTDVVEGLDAHGHPTDGNGMLDVLKLPHHGSDRNVVQEFFRRVPARTYVISADGLHSNPDPDTLDMLRDGRTESRPGETFTVVMADDLTRGSAAKRQQMEAKLAELEAAGCDVVRPVPTEVKRTLKLI